MTKKEIYNYGTLIALIKEQNEAYQKQKKGSLGWWGRARMPERDKTIFKFAITIIKDKLHRLNESKQVIESVNSDLSFISTDTKIWNDIGEQDVIDTLNVFRVAFQAHDS
ncbi:MAG: hypothetical protein RBR67_18005 [Desulfobacterium sp.]|jgi:hypothetical protein|nr:hypothetical protein [Desulfobacterium sp.]